MSVLEAIGQAVGDVVAGVAYARSRLARQKLWDQCEEWPHGCHVASLPDGSVRCLKCENRWRREAIERAEAAVIERWVEHWRSREP